MTAAPRKRGAPAQPRGKCPSCGRTGLGNTYHAAVSGGSKAYRQCRYCNEIAWVGATVEVRPAVPGLLTRGETVR